MKNYGSDVIFFKKIIFLQFAWISSQDFKQKKKVTNELYKFMRGWLSIFKINYKVNIIMLKLRDILYIILGNLV